MLPTRKREGISGQGLQLERCRQRSSRGMAFATKTGILAALKPPLSRRCTVRRSRATANTRSVTWQDCFEKSLPRPIRVKRSSHSSVSPLDTWRISGCAACSTPSNSETLPRSRRVNVKTAADGSHSPVNTCRTAAPCPFDLLWAERGLRQCVRGVASDGNPLGL
jgi:hypothetical protein